MVDLFKRSFSKKIRGYNEEEVNQFVDRIEREYSKLLSERDNAILELNRYRARENTLLKNENLIKVALQTAQQTSKDLIEGSKIESSEIISKSREAERLIVKDTIEKLTDLNHQISQMVERLTSGDEHEHR